ncbi:MAG: bifunctional folylpolyglutamate synthase/dihydrofolate synthase [Candidatus Omnitrophica bacterium]|nr:bifunctional folylpolyglutamate synthase/dihydrofolate synthase [Candidatus Omnitrophota bacterium]
MIRSYKETLKELDSFTNYENIGFGDIREEFNLDKLRQVLKKIGNPERNYRVIHIAGTKGKGSICCFVSSVLREAGMSTGLFLSPHIITPRERIQVNGEIISENEFAEIFNYLMEYLDQPANEKYTFFEMYTMVAFEYFSRKKVDFAVIEVGMGGRLDATNVARGEFCGISPISYDHTQVLGNSIRAIAEEKSAIIKPGAYCVSSPQRPDAERVIKKRCLENNAELVLAGRDLKYEVDSVSEGGSFFDFGGVYESYKNVKTSLAGIFQVDNAVTALGICEKVLSGMPGLGNILKRGIKNAYIPGRMEVLCKKPYFVADGAQNADSAANLKKSVEQIFKYDKLILLLGMSRDKDIEGVCRLLGPFAEKIVLTRALSARAADPGVIRGHIENKQVKVTANVTDGVKEAFNLAGKNDMILAAGSFFVVAQARCIVKGSFAYSLGLSQNTHPCHPRERGDL